MTSPLDERWAVFRPAKTPTLALPFGLRSVGRFRVDPQQIDDMPPRPMLQLYWCAAGRVGFDRGRTAIAAGEIFVYPVGSAHRVDTLAPATDYWWMTIDGPMADACCAAFGLTPPWPRRAGAPPERLFQRAGRLLSDPSPASERIASALAWELLSLAAAGGAVSAAGDDAVERLRRLLVDRAGDPELSVSRLAGELGEDRSVLTRRFARVVGMAPKPYLQSLRIGRAMSLLHATDTPVAIIARECGFADPGYFSRAFRERTGLTPERFRRG